MLPELIIWQGTHQNKIYLSFFILPLSSFAHRLLEWLAHTMSSRNNTANATKNVENEGKLCCLEN